MPPAGNEQAQASISSQQDAGCQIPDDSGKLAEDDSGHPGPIDTTGEPVFPEGVPAFAMANAMNVPSKLPWELPALAPVEPMAAHVATY